MEADLKKRNILKMLFIKWFLNPFLSSRKNKMLGNLYEEDSDNGYSEDEILIQNIKDAKNEWLNADMNFQYVSEDEFIEYYTYKLKAAQIKYEFFLRKAKEKGIKVNLGTSIIGREADANANKNVDINSSTYINSNSNTNITTK